MTTRRKSSLAAAVGIASLVLAHHAAAQPAQAPSAAPPPPAQAASWHTTTGPERSFTADMPAAPKYTATPMRTAAGSGYTMHQYLLEQGEVAYVIQTAVYPTDVNVSNHRNNLQGGLDNAAKNMEGGKWASIGWVTHQGFTAVDAVGRRSGHTIRLFLGHEGTADLHTYICRPPGFGTLGRRRPTRRLPAHREIGQ